MREDARHQATEFLKDRSAADHIDAARLEAGVAGVLSARPEDRGKHRGNRHPKGV